MELEKKVAETKRVQQGRHWSAKGALAALVKAYAVLVA